MSLYNLEAIKITLPAAFQSIAWRGGQDSTYFICLRKSIIIAKTKIIAILAPMAYLEVTKCYT